MRFRLEFVSSLPTATHPRSSPKRDLALNLIPVGGTNAPTMDLGLFARHVACPESNNLCRGVYNRQSESLLELTTHQHQ